MRKTVRFVARAGAARRGPAWASVATITIAGAVAVGLGTAQPGSGGEVERMLNRVLRSPEVSSRVVITRSDPFGGPDDRTSGKIWFLPGRGFRYRSEEQGGDELVLDREKGTFLVYRSGEKVLYRAAWERAPARLRQLVTEPERFLERGLKAVPERHTLGGASRAGFRLKRTALGDSLPSVSVWLAADPATGLPRWVIASGEEDSVQVEFRGMTLLSKANPGDLALRPPRGVRTEPLDPRELLPDGESR